jgi:deazaflavin-dependent oxidoreductase (nitroreductase family)
MDEKVKQALARDRVIDITTIGRKTGRPHRVEIAFYNLDGRLYLTGLPGRRDWYANLLAHSRFTLHLKQSVRADLPGKATPIVERAKRRELLSGVLKRWGRSGDLEAWVRHSPLVEVTLQDGR